MNLSYLQLCYKLTNIGLRYTFIAGQTHIGDGIYSLSKIEIIIHLTYAQYVGKDFFTFDTFSGSSSEDRDR